MHHKKEHLIRAVLEGVIYNLYTVLLALKELIGEPKNSSDRRLCKVGTLETDDGGHLPSRRICSESFESSCLGAAILGLYSLGEIDTLSVVSEMVGADFHHEPNMESVEKYKDLTPIYIRLSRQLEEEYESIAAYQKVGLKAIYQENMVTYKEVLLFLGYSFNIKYFRSMMNENIGREGYENEG